MRSMALFALLVILLVGVVLPASAAQSLTTDKIVDVRIAGDVYWGAELIWTFQVASGPNSSPQPLVAPIGAIVTYTVTADGTDDGKPINLKVDSGSAIQPTDGKFVYHVVDHGAIVVRTEYVGAVRDDRPFIKLWFIHAGHNVTHGNTKGGWPFLVNIVKAFPVKCANDARMAMLFGRSTGSPVGLDLRSLTAPKGDGQPAPKVVYADGATTDDNFAKQAEMNDLLLKRDDVNADGLQATDTRINGLEARIARMETSWTAQTRPAASVAPAEQNDFAMTIAQKNAGKVGVVFVLRPGCPENFYRIFTRKGPDADWDPQPNVLKIVPGDGAIWTSSVASLYRKGYREFGVALEQSGLTPALGYSLDPQSLRVLVLGGE